MERLNVVGRTPGLNPKAAGAMDVAICDFTGAACCFAGCCFAGDDFVVAFFPI
jgi:hypothetical protein